jgi:hypothetical protein
MHLSQPITVQEITILITCTTIENTLLLSEYSL